MVARDDEFAALAIDMAEHGFGGRDTVQANLALGQLHVHGPDLLSLMKVGPLDNLINLDYANQYEKI
jgi:hypothetical protein